MCKLCSTLRSEWFPFIVWGSGGWTLVSLQLLVVSFSLHFRVVFASFFCVVNSVSVEEAAKPRLCCCAHVAVSMGEAAKRISSRVSACLLPSPCLWGKLQSLVSSFCLSSGVAMSMGEAARPRLFCCAHVAVSMGETAKPHSFCCVESLLVLGSSLCKLCSTQYWEVFCASFIVQCSTGNVFVQAL